MRTFITRIGVVGGGTMGAGIAQVALQNGFQVILYDIAEDILHNAKAQITHYIQRAVEKGRATQEEADNAIKHLSTTTHLKDFGGVDFAIEAVPEKMDLKQDVFKRLDDITDNDIVLATNTSTLSVTRIGAATNRPQQVVGMHFFNPAPLMPLVEVIAGAETDDEAVSITTDLARKLDKSPVKAQDTPGFIVNRVARPFYLEGLRLLEQGVADHATIDRLIREGGGFPMGPFQLMDLIGVDINYHASREVYEAYFHEPRFRPSIRQQRMMDSGRLGRKTGKGWYTYEEGS